MASAELKLTLEFDGKAIKQLVFVYRVLSDLEDDLPYRPEVGKARRMLRRAVKRLKPKSRN